VILDAERDEILKRVMQFYYFDHIPIDDTVYMSRDFNDFPVQ